MLRGGSLALMLLSLSACSWVAGDLPTPGEPSSAAAGASSGAGGSAGVAGSAAASSGGAGAAGTGGAAAGAAGTGAGGAAGGPGGSGGAQGCLDPCDCDGDGEPSVACGGADCDDNDPQVSPGQQRYFPVAAQNPAVLFDYNCNGQIERDPALNVSASCGLLALLSCSGQGFSADPPPCGERGAWGQCVPDGLVCKHQKLSERTMTCR